MRISRKSLGKKLTLPSVIAVEELKETDSKFIKGATMLNDKSKIMMILTTLKIRSLLGSFILFDLRLILTF